MFMNTRLPLLSFLFLIFSGCTSIDGVPERSVDIESELNALAPYFAPSVIVDYNAKLSDFDKREYRNEVIAARMRAIDLNFNEFIKNISSESKYIGIGTDTAVLLLNAVGAVSTVSSTQAILSASSASILGTKSSIDKNAFFDTTLSALVSQMQATRAQTLVKLYLGLSSSVTDYPLMLGLVDIENYFQAGTIIGAVSEISKTAGNAKIEAEEEVKEIRSGEYLKDQAGNTLRELWKPNGTTKDKYFEGKLEVWMKKNNIDASITYFFYSADFAEYRKKALKELKL
jgi:hypothetical protein